VRIDVRDRSAAPSISAPPRSASREGASGIMRWCHGAAATAPLTVDLTVRLNPSSRKTAPRAQARATRCRS
jgi:hypothetical protein